MITFVAGLIVGLLVAGVFFGITQEPEPPRREYREDGLLTIKYIDLPSDVQKQMLKQVLKERGTKQGS